MILENNQFDLSSELLLNGNQNAIAVLEPLGLNGNNSKDCGCGSTRTILESLKLIELTQIGLFPQNISSTISLESEPFFGELQGFNPEIVMNEQINGSSNLVDELKLLDNTGDLSKSSDQLRNELSIARRSPEGDGDDGEGGGDDGREGRRFRFRDDDDDREDGRGRFGDDDGDDDGGEDDDDRRDRRPPLIIIPA